MNRTSSAVHNGPDRPAIPEASPHADHAHDHPVEVEMSPGSEDGAYSELYMGFRIHMRDGIYIASPLDWSLEGQEAIVATDLETIRQEIRRWWYQVGA